MRRPEERVVLRDGLEDHPATRAWRRVQPDGIVSEIRIIKEPSKGVKKSAVYWLGDAGPGRHAVIAKLSRRAAAELEALIYEEFLPQLTVPAPAYRGMVDEGGEFFWLFMDYLPGGRYSPADPEHRRIAGRWIARLHREAASLPHSERLPVRGMTHHLASLRRAAGALLAHGDDPSLSRAEASTIQQLAALLSEVQGSWSTLEAVCAELPETLVHGDLVRKNVRICAAGGTQGMAAFDWENAGWGPPAVDLAQSLRSERFAPNACLDSYRAAHQPDATLTREDVERQATAGTVLRCVTAIDWTSQSLGPSWRDGPEGLRQDFLKKRGKTLPRLEVYLAWLRRGWLSGRLQVRV